VSESDSRPLAADPEAARRQAAEDQLLALRGRAIQEYSSVEQSLCWLFSHLAGTGQDVDLRVMGPMVGAAYALTRPRQMSQYIRKSHIRL